MFRHQHPSQISYESFSGFYNLLSSLEASKITSRLKNERLWTPDTNHCGSEEGDSTERLAISKSCNNFVSAYQHDEILIIHVFIQVYLFKLS